MHNVYGGVLYIAFLRMYFDLGTIVAVDRDVLVRKIRPQYGRTTVATPERHLDFHCTAVWWIIWICVRS